MKKYTAFIVLFFLVTSCSSIRDAKQVVAECDSLHAVGVSFTDSLRLACAVESLKSFRLVYPNDYAKANYYYGKLLRSKENYVAAMQCFIDAKNSHSTDKKLYGRLYSNFGSMCHLADSFALSYEMYKKSANYFSSIDSISYSYALYNMAYEKAEVGKKNETLEILNKIKNNDKSSYLSNLITLTKAEMYYKIQQYDSAIFFAKQLLSDYQLRANSTIIIAQSYSHLELNDSAVSYANKVMVSPSKYQDKYNAIYILSKKSKDLTPDSINQLSSLRTDIRHYNYEPQQRKLTEAIVILKQDLYNKKVSLTIYLIPLFLILIVIFFLILNRKKLKDNQKKIQDLKQEHQQLESQNNQLIDKQKSILYIQQQISDNILDQINKNAQVFYNSDKFKEEICWNNYSKMRIIVNHQFYLIIDKLEETKLLSEKEIKMCVLVLMGFSREQISDILPYSKNSVGKYKDTIAKKLGTTGRNLKKFLINMILGQEFPNLK